MRKLFICLFLACSMSVSAQIITPQEKSVLDQYYAKSQTNGIPGSYIITNSLPFDRLEIPVQVQINNGSNAWVWVTANSNDIAQMLSRTSNWDEAYNWVAANSNMTIEANFYSFIYTQTFAAASWQIKTSTVGYTRGDITATTTSATINVDGWYRIDYSGSYEISTVSTDVDGHLHTNDIDNVRIGWSRDSGTAASKQGSYSGGGTLYLTNGTLLTTKILASKNCDIIWDHYDWNIKRR